MLQLHPWISRPISNHINGSGSVPLTLRYVTNADNCKWRVRVVIAYKEYRKVFAECYIFYG